MLMSQRSNNYVFAYDGSMKSFVQWKTFFPITKSNTTDGAIKRWLVHFELPIQKRRGHIYDGGSNLMGKKSGVAQQILKQLPKALITHCHGYLPSFSIKDANKQCQIQSKTMKTAGEIIVLIKFSPKRKWILGAINENIEVSSDGDGPERAAFFLLPTWLASRTSFSFLMPRPHYFEKLFVEPAIYLGFFIFCLNNCFKKYLDAVTK